MYYEISFKIDTGADFTTISRSKLLQLGYDIEWIMSNYASAEGTSNADGSKAASYRVKFPLFNLHGLDFRNWPITVIFDSTCECGKITHRDYRNLIGNDVLDMFDLTRLAKGGTFELRPVPPFVIRNRVFHDQTVDEVILS